MCCDIIELQAFCNLLFCRQREQEGRKVEAGRQRTLKSAKLYEEEDVGKEGKSIFLSEILIAQQYLSVVTSMVLTCS